MIYVYISHSLLAFTKLYRAASRSKMRLNMCITGKVLRAAIYMIFIYGQLYYFSVQ